jgi:glutamate-1-semialdehyde 2,1-aminomutase
MWTLFFTGQPVTDYASAKTCDTARFGRFFWEMMDRGVYLPCSQFEAAFNSVLHDEALVDRTLKAADAALLAVSRG